jgi:N-acetylglucosamine kinase-like BadF-type ATPase
MLFLGVDGGGTKTAALLADEHGQILGTGMGGAANYQIAGMEQTVASVKQAVGRFKDAYRTRFVFAWLARICLLTSPSFAAP